MDPHRCGHHTGDGGRACQPQQRSLQCLATRGGSPPQPSIAQTARLVAGRIRGPRNGAARREDGGSVPASHHHLLDVSLLRPLGNRGLSVAVVVWAQDPCARHRGATSAAARRAAPCCCPPTPLPLSPSLPLCLLACLLAYRLNSSLNLLNKWALGHAGFRFPFLLTSCEWRPPGGRRLAAVDRRAAQAGPPLQCI